MNSEKNFIIAIPTYNRYDVLFKSDGPLQYLPESLRDNTFLFVREEELEKYLPVVEYFGIGMYPLDLNPEDRMAETRDAIMKLAKEELGFRYIIMMDDDVKFAVHELENPKTTYHKMSPEEFETMCFKLVDVLNEETPLSGIKARQFSMDKKSETEENGRIIQVFGMDLDIILSEGFKFNYGQPCISDYYFVITLLKNGYKNIVLNRYTRDDTPNSPGGCATYRTAEMQTKSAVALYKLFPDVITLKQKKGSSWKEVRVNPIVRWKKAYRPRGEK